MKKIVLTLMIIVLAVGVKAQTNTQTIENETVEVDTECVQEESENEHYDYKKTKKRKNRMAVPATLDPSASKDTDNNPYNFAPDKSAKVNSNVKASTKSSKTYFTRKIFR